ncbi:ATP-binding cassette domain-containing protein [Mycobacterium xenopi]|uniref:ABC transporter ATP-binding/permease protein n=1 Tax=Mycobacterium xenopi TaxID=1789 RepID=A0AAD1H560_MYCXE|nr:ABC transporter ATP-binding/permease protein [Mycobacterium xenopi]SPX89968.1 ABC transporter ATP-binding protein [Mycobacterium xenopi]
MTPTNRGITPSHPNRSSQLAAMSAESSPPLTVWLGSAMYTFPTDRDVTVGRDRDCDICLHEGDRASLGLISRTHAILRFDGAQWVAVDKSQNGVFVDGVRAPMVMIGDRQNIALGSPHGPQLTFRVATSAAPAEPRNPPTLDRMSAAQANTGNARTNRFPRAVLAPPMPRTPPAPPQPRRSGRFGDTMRFLLPPRPGVAPPGTTTVGRTQTNDVVIEDALASRMHAMLVPTPAGIEIRDNNSSNGTFVNGTRISRAVLRDGDIVTIGNTDLLAAGNTLLPRPAPAHTSGLTADGLGLNIDGHTLLTNVSFTARPGTLTAVIGPSGAGKSTLVKLIGGTTAPSAGVVSFEGHNVHAEYASMRSRIGIVPQDDVVHRQLTVEQALSYAAELRLPPDTSAADRGQVVTRVLDELDLTPHRKTRVDKLSGGQRKRASVAMELLTGPSLLILDEPTSGLDPALDRQVMTMLRRLADAGRVVIVVTHSLNYVNMCDQILLLAPGGKTAFADSPRRIGPVMGTTDWADIFARVSTDPDGVHRAFLARHPAPPRPSSSATGAVPLGVPPHTSMWRQISTIARRQTRLIAADRGYFAFLAVLPFVLGSLLLAVPGNTGLGFADPRASQADEPSEILILLNIAAVFMGTALTIRDLVGERTIFKREQAVGLSASAYLLAKVLVYSVAALIQTAVLTAILVAGKSAPTRGAVLLGNGVAELYVTLAATAIASAMVGLALSSLARSGEQILPMLVVAIMVSMVLAGGLIPVTGRMGLSQVSWLVPARWGFAASASTVDLRHIEVDVPADRLWLHSPRYWLLDMGMLVTLGLAATVLVRFRLRLPARGHAR